MLRRFRCNYRGCLIVFNVLKAAWLRHFPCCAYIDGAVEPDVTTPPAGETDGGEVPGDSTDKSPTDANPAAGEPATGPTANPALKPDATTTKTTTTVTKTTVAKTSKPKTATATTAALPKTGDSHWIAVSTLLFVLGTMLLVATYRC